MLSLLAIATLSTTAEFQLTVTNSHNVVNFLTTLQIGAVNAVNWTILNIIYEIPWSTSGILDQGLKYMN